MQNVGLMSNVSFGSGAQQAGDPFEQFKRQQNGYTQKANQQDQVEIGGQKKTFGEKIQDTKEKAIGVVTSCNTAATTTSGVVQGIFRGSIATLATGVLAKNIAANKNNSLGAGIANVIGGVITDGIKGLGYTIGKCKNIWNTTVGQIVKSPKKIAADFFGSAKEGTGYLKGNKALATIAVAAGLVTLVANVISARIKANKQAANIREAAGLDKA